MARFFGHAGAGVANLNNDVLSLGGSAENQCAAVRHRVDRIENKVREPLAKFGRVARDSRDFPQVSAR